MSKEFGEKLKELRINSGLTQTQIAKPLNVDRSTYSNYERGVSEPGIDGIKLIAKIFNVSAEVLLPTEKKSAVVNDSSDTPIYNLKKDEKALISWYRALGEEQQKDMRNFALTLAKENSKNSKK